MTYIYDRKPVRSAALEKPFPSRVNEVRETARRIREGGDGEMHGSDLFQVFDALGIRNFGMISGLGEFGVNVIFFRKEDGQIGYDTVYPASIIRAEQIRGIIACAYSHDKHCSEERRSQLVRLKDVLEQLRREGSVCA